jgi:hypothetical protein
MSRRPWALAVTLLVNEPAPHRKRFRFTVRGCSQSLPPTVGAAADPDGRDRAVDQVTFVGREHEIVILERGLAAARESEGGVVLSRLRLAWARPRWPRK